MSGMQYPEKITFGEMRLSGADAGEYITSSMLSMRALLDEFDAQHPAAAPNDLAGLSLPLSECKFEASRNNA